MNVPIPRNSWLARVIPAVAALVLTAAAIGAGAANHWRIKPFSELTGQASVEADDWCADHGVAKSACVECDRALFPRRPAFGWCKTHGVHECPLCHPEAAELPSPAAVTAADRDRAARALAFTERTANHPKCTFHTRRIQ